MGYFFVFVFGVFGVLFLFVLDGESALPAVVVQVDEYFGQ
jgi:hypothetical protein